MTGRTEADAVAEIARAATAVPQFIEPGFIATFVLNEGQHVENVDLERSDERPRRRRGVVTALDADSFARLVLDLGPQLGRTSVYADVTACTVTAILNDDEPGDFAAWRDHRIVLPVVRTPQWERWLARNGKIGEQTAFAQHLEENMADIITPDAADLLELAQTFEASTQVQFRSAARLKDGARQFTYSETIEASAGRQGTITVPDVFLLLVAPFEGAQSVEVTARLRYRLDGGRLAIGYELHQPADVERAAFDVVVEKIGAASSIAPYRAKAPAATA